MIGGLVLCSTNAWAAENPAIGTTIAVPLLAGAFVLLRGLLPWAAYGMGGLAGISWLVLLGLGLGPLAGDGRARRVVGRLPRMAAPGRGAVRRGRGAPPRRPGRAAVRGGRPDTPAAGAAGQRAGHGRAPTRATCSWCAPPWRPSRWSPRSRRGSGHRGPPCSPRSGCSCSGLLLIDGPWPALVALNNDGSSTQELLPRRRSPPQLRGQPWSSRSPWSLPQPACCVTSPNSCAGTRPTSSGRSHLPWSPSAGSCWCSSSNPRCGRLSSLPAWRPRSPAAPPGGLATRPSPPCSAAAPRRT